ASGDVGGRARVLEAMGRHDRAIELVWDSTEDPLSRAERLRDLGWYDEADAALRDIEGREARAAQVENALARDGRSLMDCRPIELERAVRRVCGDDLGCAVTSRLLSVGTWPRPNPVVALFGGPTPDLERATWMLRMADAVEAPPPSVLAARIRWRAELAIAQLQLGAVDAAWRSIEAAHHDYRGLGEGWWSDERQRLRRLRAVAHLRDGHPERAHGRDWIFGPLVAIAQGDDTVAWPYADGVPPFERRRALAARRPIALDFPPTAEGYEEIVWSAHRLTPDARERLASELRRSPETVQTPVRQTSRARALRALGDETTARAIEAEVRRLRVAEYGW
ncbi:MAG: hypothetical protein KC619_16270, partial [Myxococcales bacterium]|nr:hypothetical protein [Myxococcales bacterium]